MDRTARMMRRTLLCAVFACPLALWRYDAAVMMQSLFVFLLLYGRKPPVQWAHARRGFHAGLGRAIFGLCMGLMLSGVLQKSTVLCGSAALQAWIRVLSVLSGLLLQCVLLYRIRITGKLHYAACLFALFVFIACMRSGASPP